MRLTILAYLASARPRGFHSRDEVLGIFWPDIEQDQARNRLRQALHQLRKFVGEDAFTSRGDREVGVDEAVLVCDAAQFDDAIDAGRLEDALALYGGEFLAGLFLDDAPEAEQWIEQERLRRRHAAVNAALVLAEREEANEQYRSAALWARKALSLTRHDENVLRRVLLILDAADDSAGALQLFAEFERAMRAELEQSPSAETLRIVEQLRVRAARQSTATGAPTVEKPESVPVAVPSAALHESVVRPRRTSRVVALVGIALIVAIGMAALVTRKPERPAAGRLTPTLAVLPFVNMSGDSTNEYFSDGITEEILHTLAKVDGLRIAARTSAFMFKNKAADVREVGDKLGVATVLEGSVRRAGNRIKITAQLISVADGYQLWSETYDREVGDIFEVQEEIARSIARALQMKLESEAAAEHERHTTSSSEAYDLYLRGKHLITSGSEERNRRAIEYFEEAIAKDPRFPLPYAGLARAYMFMGDFVAPKVVLAKAKQAVLRALQLDSSLVETRLALADVRQVYDRDWGAAERELLRALAISPKSPQAHRLYSNFLLESRRYAEAFTERERTWSLRDATTPDTTLPAYRIEKHVSWAGFFIHARRYPDALTHARAALALDPNNVTALWAVSFVEQQAGNYDAAIAQLEKIRDQTNGSSAYLPHLGRAYGAAGRRGEAEAILNTLLERARRQYVPKDQIALVYLGLGDISRALDYLEGAVDDYHWWMATANSHPLWNGLNEHPRFSALMRKIGAPGR